MYSTPTIARQAAKQSDLEEFGVIFLSEGIYSYEEWASLLERLHGNGVVGEPTVEEHWRKFGPLWVRV
jgi:hypothetical protein